MPKLNQKTAKSVADASSNFPIADEAVLHVRLRNVDGTGEGPAGPYWRWEFEIVEPGAMGTVYDDKGKEEGKAEVFLSRLWTNTSLADNAQWKMKETFDAFGVSTDTDTDELLGEVCRAAVTIRTIQQGTRKGELTNQIEKLLPKAEDFELPEEAQQSDGLTDEDDIFS